MLRDMPGLPGAGLRYAMLSALAVVASVWFPGVTRSLELSEQRLSIADDQTTPPDESAGESVGEPSTEDAPVEGEPGVGEPPDLPPDEPADEALPPAAPDNPASKS